MIHIYRKIGTLIILLTVCFLMGCMDQAKHESNVSIPYLGAVHGDTLNKKFVYVDSLYSAGAYKLAWQLYDTLLRNADLSTEESYYALSNLIYSAIKAKDTLGVSQRLVDMASMDEALSNSTAAEYLLYKGLLAVNPDSIIHYTHKGVMQNSDNPRLHLELGMAYHQLMEIDSAVFNLRRVLTNQEVTGFNRFKANYLLADLSLVSRDYFNGLRYVNDALEKPLLMQKHQIEAITLKAKLLRKLGRTDESTKLLEAQLLISDLQDKRKVPIYEELAFNALAESDSLNFQKLITKLEVTPGGQRANFRLKGSFYYGKQVFDKAAFYYEKVLNDLQRKAYPNLVIVKEALFVLAESYHKLNNFEMAREYAYRSLVYESPYRNSSFQWANLFSDEVISENYNFFNYNKLGELSIEAFEKQVNPDIKDLENALKMYEVIDSVISLQINVLEEEAVLAFLKIGHSIYTNGVRLCFIMDSVQSDLYYRNLAFQFIEKSRGVMLMRDILVYDSNNFEHIPKSYKTRELELKAAISKYKNSDDNEHEKLAVLLKEQADYFSQMKKLYPDYYKARLQAIKKINLRELQVVSDSTAQTFIQFLQTPESIFKLIIEPEEILFEHIPITPELQQSLYRFLTLVRQGSYSEARNSYQEFVSTSYYLFNQLIGDGLTNMDLVISTNGFLDQLPFDALITTNKVDSIEVNYSRLAYLGLSGTVMRTHKLAAFIENNKVFKRSETKLVGYGFSNENTLQSKTFKGLKELPGSWHELQQIIAIYGVSNVLLRTGFQATTAQFREDFNRDVDIMHLALHARSSTENKLDNKIYFRSASRAYDSLYGYELLAYQIPARLVVLSACESAKGKDVVGEGTYSLSRAFIQAGASNVVASLWEQVDFSSRIIYKNFYEGLYAEKSIGKALFLAKRDYLAQSNNYNSHPAYWAGVVGY